MKLSNNQPPDFLIKTAWHSIQRMYAEIARSNGISQAMGFVLISIEKQGSTPSEISQKVGVKAISLTRVFNELLKRKLITRNIDIKDGRKAILELTDDGIEARKIISKIINDFNDLLSQKISADELLVLQKIVLTVESLTSEYADISREQNNNY
jgi:DNA-binding MarR family transcriptional regulator